MKQISIVWFEIPVKNLDRAILFYSQLFDISIEKKEVYKTMYGIISKNDIGIGGSLVEKPEHVGNGIKLFFHVPVLSDILDGVLSCGGKLITPKSLLKQIGENGKTILAHNLIDHEVGYYAEILDSEGNPLCLYSHY